MVETIGEVLVVEQRVQDVHGQEHRSYIQHLQENANLQQKLILQLYTNMCELQVKRSPGFLCVFMAAQTAQNSPTSFCM